MFYVFHWQEHKSGTYPAKFYSNGCGMTSSFRIEIDQTNKWTLSNCTECFRSQKTPQSRPISQSNLAISGSPLLPISAHHASGYLSAGAAWVPAGIISLRRVQISRFFQYPLRPYHVGWKQHRMNSEELLPYKIHLKIIAHWRSKTHLLFHFGLLGIQHSHSTWM